MNPIVIAALMAPSQDTGVMPVRIAPAEEATLLGRAIEGNLASWAEDDHDPRGFERFFDWNFEYIRVQLTFQLLKPWVAEKVAIRVKVATFSAGTQKVTLYLKRNDTFYEPTDVVNALLVEGRTYVGKTPFPARDHINSLGQVRGQIEVRRYGPNQLRLPRVSFELCNLDVSY